MCVAHEQIEEVVEEVKPKRVSRELTGRQLEAKKLRQEIRQQELDVRLFSRTTVTLYWNRALTVAS